MFGSDAILSDMTLLALGREGRVPTGNTTLGRIGVGYIYTDWIPQISYSSRSTVASSIQPACSRAWTFSTSQALRAARRRRGMISPVFRPRGATNGRERRGKAGRAP